ncbi:Prion like protein [Aphelenchoides fujianensis]|nr:Prion like protein [Aphelenchoides fujianensis]
MRGQACLWLLATIPVFAAQSVDYPDEYGNSRNSYGNTNNNNPNPNLNNPNLINSNSPIVNPGSNYRPNQYNAPLQSYDGQSPPPIMPFPPAPFPNSTHGGNNYPVQVQVQLRSYLNSRLMLDSTRTCACDSGDCILTSPQNMGYRCFFSFMIIVSSADSSVQYKATDFLLLNQAGQIDSNYTQRFSEMYTFSLDNQPTAIDVFVHNLGPVINAFTKKLEQSTTVYHVDTFVHPLNSSSAFGSRSGQMQQVQLSGSLLGTQLALSYSVSCRGHLIGPGCDMSCNSSTVNSNTAICQNNRTGYFSVCRWLGGRSQVTDCQNCPWGIRENAYCTDESGMGVLEAHHAGVVSEGFRTATIILGVACGLLFLLLIFTIVVCCLRQPKQQSRTARNGRNYETEYLTQGNDDIRPLNTAANPNTTFSTTASSTPQPAPRNQPPSLGARPSKSALRAPHLYQLPPASHLTGGANSLNSSFSSTVPPVPPSVSADV